MNEIKKNIRSEFILELISKHGSERSALLPVLQEFQNKFGYIDSQSQQEIAFEMEIHPVEVNSVISFYAFLYDKPMGRNIVRICKNIVCEFHGSNDITEAVKKEFNIEPGETTKDGKLTFELISCFGMCDKSPTMMVNGNVYENMNRDTAVKILKDLN